MPTTHLQLKDGGEVCWKCMKTYYWCMQCKDNLKWRFWLSNANNSRMEKVIVKDVLLDGGCRVNIVLEVTKEARNEEKLTKSFHGLG